jgi:hypothetical protein
MTHPLLCPQTLDMRDQQPTIKQPSPSCTKDNPPNFLVLVCMDAMAPTTMTRTQAKCQLKKSCIRSVVSQTKFHGRHLLSPSWSCANVSRIMELL